MTITRMSRTKTQKEPSTQMPDETINKMLEGVEKRIEIWHGINRLVMAKNQPEIYSEQKAQLTQKENIIPLIELAGEEEEEAKVREEAKKILEDIRKAGYEQSKFYIPKDAMEIITSPEYSISIRVEAIRWLRGVGNSEIKFELECISKDIREDEEIRYEAMKALNWYNLQ